MIVPADRAVDGPDRGEGSIMGDMQKTAAKNKTMTTRTMAYTAMGAVVMVLCSWITVPGPVPFTLQTFAVFALCGLLGGKAATAAVGLYILLGAVGLPVYAGFQGGFGVLVGMLGGYILGFLMMTLVYWLVTGLFGHKMIVSAAGMLLGLLVCYAFGTAWFMVVYTGSKGSISLAATLGKCVIPFILPDLLKMGIALAVVKRAAPALNLQKN